MARLHPSVQQAIDDPSGADKRANVMMATHGKLTPEQRAQLESLECHVRTVAGDVITLDLPVRSLDALGKLEFARYVELTRPLQTEKPRTD
jgi:hypothetical protein